MYMIFKIIRDFVEKIKMLYRSGVQWIGTDGLINTETSALLTIFLMIFFQVIWAAVISFTIVMLKCILDKTRGHHNEKRDFICAIVGVLVGAILGPAQAAWTLFQ